MQAVNEVKYVFEESSSYSEHSLRCALPYFRQLAGNSRSLTVAINTAKLYLSAQRWSEAMQVLSAALTHNDAKKNDGKTLLAARLLMLECYIKLDKTEKALELLALVAADNPC